MRVKVQLIAEHGIYIGINLLLITKHAKSLQRNLEAWLVNEDLDNN